MRIIDSESENPDVDPASLLAYRVLMFSQSLYRGIELLLQQELGLSVRQWRVLLFLASHGSCSPQDIAVFWRYDKSQVSRAVAELLTKKLVVVERAPHDTRRIMVSLTRAGQVMYERGLPLSLARQERLIHCLTPAELTSFERTLSLLTRQADAMLALSDDAKKTPAGPKKGQRRVR